MAGDAKRAFVCAGLSSKSDRFAGGKLFDLRNPGSLRRERRIVFWRRRAIARRRSGRRWGGRRGFCGHGWRVLRRGQGIGHWCGVGPFPAFARFPAFQDDAAIFGHPRPAGPDAMLLQQIGDGGVGRILLAQCHDGIVNWFQAVERDAVRIGPEFLNRLAQRFKIESGWGWCVHDLWIVMDKS